MPRFHILLVYAWLSAMAIFSAKRHQRKEIWGLMVHQPNLTLAEISRITAPTLVVTGENDMVSQQHNDEISFAIANSKRLVIPNGNHFWMFTDPELFNQCIVRFLSMT
jgi:pimeloyl-ACP methyl ester carboxylesterase